MSRRVREIIPERVAAPLVGRDGRDGRDKSAPTVCLHVVRPARVDVRAQRAADALARAGYAVVIIDVEEEAQTVEEEERGFRVRHIMLPRWHHTRRFEPFFFLKALQAFVQGLSCLLRCDADIYHACEVTALPACFIAAKIRRKPLIFEAYELPLHDVPLSEMGRLRRVFHGLLSLLLPRLIPACQAVIAVSPPIVAEIKRCYSIERVFLVRNILSYRAVARSDRLREHLDLALSARIVLYQGNLQLDRGLDILVRAAPLLDPDTMIVLMGKGVGATQERLESLIRELDVAGRIRIIPPVPYDELLDWTASADIGLTPMSLEYTLTVKWCLPNKVFEYIMAGLPILAAPLPAVQELIARYDVGQTVTPPAREGATCSPIEVAHTINAMLADRDSLARMRENALRAARELCWENESERLIEVYESVLHGLRTT
ncbi:MAG: glycosyltransferase [Ktedonobacteraceae bacterium]